MPKPLSQIVRGLSRRVVPTVLLALSLSSCGLLGATVSTHPHVVQRYTVGGYGGWDHLSYDVVTERLFIARTDRVMVVDAVSGKLLGEIGGTDGVHEVLLMPERRRGYTSDGRGNTLTEFDLDTLAVLRRIALKGRGPDALVADPVSGHLFVFEGGSNEVEIMDLEQGTSLASIPLRGDPGAAATDGKGRIYVNLQNRRALAVIDTLENRVIENRSLGKCQDPTALALDLRHRLSFSTCQNRNLVVLDLDSGDPVAQPPLGEGPDDARFDDSTNLLYIANGEGNLQIFTVDSQRQPQLVNTVATQRAARTLALDIARQRVFLPVAKFSMRMERTPESRAPRPAIDPDSFGVLVVR